MKDILLFFFKVLFFNLNGGGSSIFGGCCFGGRNHGIGKFFIPPEAHFALTVTLLPCNAFH